MGKKDLKSDLIELFLEDNDLRIIIREICKDDSLDKGASNRFYDKDKYDYTTNNTDSIKKEHSVLPDWFSKNKDDENKNLKMQLKDSEEIISDLRDEIRNLKNKISTDKEIYDAANQENLRMKSIISNQKSENEQLLLNFHNAEEENNSLKRNIRSLQEKFKQAQEKVDYQENVLSQRFAKGWELFCSYQNVSEQSKRLLSGVFVKSNSFTSFICGGSQDRSLEKIWDVIKGCLSQGNTKDAEILWDIFEYDVELVNSAKTERIYEILQVEIGESFDLDVHTLAAGSRAQGNIQEVYLLGYKNIYAGRIERKSIVSV